LIKTYEPPAPFNRSRPQRAQRNLEIILSLKTNNSSFILMLLCACALKRYGAQARTLRTLRFKGLRSLLK
jgi:hypothetical protein